MSQGSYPRTASASPSPGGLRRKYTLQLSLPAIISAVIIFVIGVGWVFAFGVIVGRGYNPEKKMPELAKLLPAPAGQEQATAPILKPEELTFMADLKQNPTLSKGQPETKPDRAETKPGYKPEATKPDGKTDPKVGAGKPGTVDAAGAGQAGAKPGQTAKPGTATTQDTKPAVDGKQKYDFVIQVVAYKNSGQADALRERLEGEGLRTRMSIERDAKKKPKWYRVQVLLRGTESDVPGVKARLASLGVKDASVASKKPVSKGRNR